MVSKRSVASSFILRLCFFIVFLPSPKDLPSDACAACNNWETCIVNMEEIEEDLDHEEEEMWQWHQAASMAAACHGKNHYCAKLCGPCRTAPYTGNGLVQEFLETHQWRRCQELVRMPMHTFCNLIEFCKEHTALQVINMYLWRRSWWYSSRLLVDRWPIGVPRRDTNIQEIPSLNMSPIIRIYLCSAVTDSWCVTDVSNEVLNATEIIHNKCVNLLPPPDNMPCRQNIRQRKVLSVF